MPLQEIGSTWEAVQPTRNVGQLAKVGGKVVMVAQGRSTLAPPWICSCWIPVSVEMVFLLKDSLAFRVFFFMFNGFFVLKKDTGQRINVILFFNNKQISRINPAKNIIRKNYNIILLVLYLLIKVAGYNKKRHAGKVLHAF